MSRRRVLVAIWATAGVLVAPWVVDAVVRRAQRAPWRAPQVPVFRLDTGRRIR